MKVMKIINEFREERSKIVAPIVERKIIKPSEDGGYEEMKAPPKFKVKVVSNEKVPSPPKSEVDTKVTKPAVSEEKPKKAVKKSVRFEEPEIYVQ